MTLFRDGLLTVQDEYLRDDVLRVDPEDDDEVGYDNDDIGENTEITPIGDDLDEEDIEDAYMPGPDDEDLPDDDEDVLLDDEELLDDDDEVVDLHKIRAIGGDDDDEDLDEDDIDDDFDDTDSATVVPDDDDDLLADDDDDEFDTFDEDEDLDDEGSTTQGLNRSVDVNVPGRSSSSIIDHEPGTISPRDI